MRTRLLVLPTILLFAFGAFGSFLRSGLLPHLSRPQPLNAYVYIILSAAGSGLAFVVLAALCAALIVLVRRVVRSRRPLM